MSGDPLGSWLLARDSVGRIEKRLGKPRRAAWLRGDVGAQAIGQVERAFVHIHFSYTNGLTSRLATNFYLASGGKDKVGFTPFATADKAQPQFIGGVRGIAERNTMRYFLAIDAHLSALSIPRPQRFEESSERWFAATERYALQLREPDHDTYVAMKRAEYQRQNL